MPVTYTMHRRINAPLEFRGLKGRYIFYAGGLLVGALLIFAILYISGANGWICLPLVVGSAAAGIGGIYRLSHRYGEHGWAKRQAARRIPKAIRCNTRTLFIELKH